MSSPLVPAESHCAEGVETPAELRRREKLTAAKRYKKGCLMLLTLPVILALYLAYLARDMKGWAATQGELVQEETRTRWTPPRQTEYGTIPPTKELVTKYQYRYRVEGKDLYIWSERFLPEPGSNQIRIYYNPRDPHQATLVQPESFNAIPFYWAIGLSLLVWVVGKVTLKPR